MQFPFDGDDVSDATPRRFRRILAIGLVCFLVLGLIGVWKLLPHGAASAGTSAQTRNDNSLNATLVWIPAGTFTMGSVKNEENGANVGSQVTVTLTKGFWLGQTEVTQAQWQHVMHATPWSGQSDVIEGDDYPATYVSWRDALEFCKTLTDEERTAGRLPADWQYTLPTEAQWEFACRAGTTTRFSFGDNNADLAEYGWFGDNANTLGDRYPHKVGQKKANPWGLYDMHGNVSEWCEDVFTAGALPGGYDPVVSVGGSKRVMRGGNWGNPAIDCQSAARTRREPDYRGHALGFRLAAVPVSNGSSIWNDVASADALAKEPDRNGPELTPIAAPSNPPAPKTAVNKRTRPARSKPTLAGSTTPSDTLPTEKNKPIVPTGNVVIQHVGAGASAYMIQPTSDGGFDRWWVDAYGSIYNKEHVDKYGRARTAADWRGH